MPGLINPSLLDKNSFRADLPRTITQKCTEEAVKLKKLVQHSLKWFDYFFSTRKFKRLRNETNRQIFSLGLLAKAKNPRFFESLPPKQRRLFSTAEKTYRQIRQICHSSVTDQDIATYLLDKEKAKELAFVLNKTHFIYNHIIAMSPKFTRSLNTKTGKIETGQEDGRWDHDARLIMNDGRLNFVFEDEKEQTKKIYASVRSKMEEAEKHPTYAYSLEQFGFIPTYTWREDTYSYDLKGPNNQDLQGTLHDSFRQKADGKYHVQVMLGSRADHPVTGGAHTWLRFVKNDGKTASVGAYPEKFPSFFKTFASARRFYCNCESYEWYPKTMAPIVEKFDFVITKNEYDQLTKKIEDDMQLSLKNDPKSRYVTTHLNCVTWALETAAVVVPSIKNRLKEIDKEISISALSCAAGAFHKKVVHKTLLSKIVKIANYILLRIPEMIARFFRGLFILTLGGASNNLNTFNKRTLNWHDIFHTNIGSIRSPNYALDYMKRNYQKLQTEHDKRFEAKFARVS